MWCCARKEVARYARPCAWFGNPSSLRSQEKLIVKYNRLLCDVMLVLLAKKPNLDSLRSRHFL
jgi:hypothetical protein